MSLGNSSEIDFLEHVVGKVTWALPTAYVALCTASPGEAASAAGINEVANSNNYAREATAGGDWNSAAGGAIDNANAITFNTASGAWGTVTYFAIMDSATWGEGKMLVYAVLTAPKTIGNGDTPSCAAGDLEITVD